VMVFPRSVGLLLPFLVVEASVVVSEAPDVTNHWLFTLIVAVTVLVAAGAVWRRPREGPLPPDALFDAFAPVVRVEVLLLYAFAILHKLNRGYFDPVWSCAVALAPDGVPPGAAIAGSLAAEAGIVLLLVLPRTRLLGIALGAAFHIYLGSGHFDDFSAMLAALYVLFAPPDLVARAAEGARRLGLPRAPVFAPRALAGVMAAAAVLAVGYGHATARAVFGALWIPYSVGLLGIFLLASAQRPAAAAPAAPAPARVPRLLWVMPGVVALNGLCPYLGLKTEDSFAMFSNLHTEGGVTNHYLIPAAWQIAPFERDLVTVKSSSDPSLESLVGWRTPYLRLRGSVSGLAGAGAHDLRLTYERGGRTVRLARAEEDPDLSRPLPWAVHKFMPFRLVPLAGVPDICQH
ncbi:MAG TPA: hypothetical protein VGQ33_12015, partial [Vicinamibacteria bacterium]|nr:hypothetical protein [Vicinamibacteria bacterium]